MLLRGVLMYKKYIKRALDMICALAAIIVFCWLYIIVAVLVKIKLGSPVIFTQERPGKDAKIFKMYKFRTMTNEKDDDGRLLPDEQRLTKFGKFLRKTSLDELPEAFNILKGDMSVVGPRPLMARYVRYYNETEKKRHLVRPGLTGYAQIKGRNSVSWDERMKLDVFYVDNVSIVMDLRVIFSTIKIVLKREGIELNDIGNFDDYKMRKKNELFETSEKQ